MSFPEILKTLRKEKKLTQEQLGAELGLSKNTIFQYENGKREPNFEAMSKLEKYFGVSASYLKGESEKNDYKETRDELVQTLAFLLTDFSRLDKFLKNFPQEEQLEAYSFLDTAVDLLINKDIDNEEMFDYLDILNGFILDLHRFKQLLSQAKKNRNQIDIARMVEKYGRPYVNYFSDLAKLYGFQVSDK